MGFGCGCLWCARAIYWGLPLVRRMLWSSWWRVIESFEGSWDVAGHGDVNISFVIVPVEGEAAVQGTSPVHHGEFVLGFKCINEMFGVGS